MDIISSIILGGIQGLTEFLPISSSGHLILMREFLGINSVDGLAFDAVLQLATSLAVLVYFKHDFLELIKGFFGLITGKVVEKKIKVLFGAIVLGTIPAVIFGLMLEGHMETTFRGAKFVAVMLLLGSILFYIAERIAKQNENLTTKKGLLIGFFQSLALLPGMSRSGVTISGGLIFGMKREDAARFSFLLSFPIIFGSGLLKFFELSNGGFENGLGSHLFIGGISAFIVGIFAIHYLLKYLRNHTLNIFIIYRVVLAIIILIVF
jgi:undecaprenyl-diphosphatase